jgi:serine/threonine protein phosphatase PrpC
LFRRFANDKSFGGLILTTDGIINSYTSEQAYLDFIGNIFCGYKEECEKSARAELAEFLPRLSEKGSGYDLSVGVIF